VSASILHADLDAFYASVEQLLQPELRGKPVAVGGGVVLAASYEARAFGVRSGMPGRRARELCPSLIFTGGHFSEYQRLGDAAIAVLADFTPDIERISIDEAFADVSASRQLFGAPVDIASRVRARVRDELGLPISIGVARTKHLAKIASQVAKPDGLVVVDPAGELAFLHDLPVELMWGVGPATRARLAEAGVSTIGQLAQSSARAMERLYSDPAGDLDRWSKRTAYRADDDLVFAHPQTGHALDRSKVSKRFKKACKEAGVRPVRFHDLRHTFATRLAAKGTPMRTIQEFLGHADSKTTQIYSHYAPSEHEVKLVDAAFAPEPAEEPGRSALR